MVDNLFDLTNEDKKLKVNNKVAARWTTSGNSYSGLGEIVALTRKTVTVKLLENCGRENEYKKGRQIQLPRFADQTRWSSRNCVNTISSPKQKP